MPFRCFRYRKAGQKRFMSRKNRFSGSVFLDFIRRMTSDRFSGEKMSGMVFLRTKPFHGERLWGFQLVLPAGIEPTS